MVIVVETDVGARVVVEADCVAQFVRDHRLIVVLVRTDERRIHTSIPVPTLDNVDRYIAGKLQVRIAVGSLVACTRGIHHFRIPEHAARLTSDPRRRRVLQDDVGLRRIGDEGHGQSSGDSISARLIVECGNGILDSSLFIRGEAAVRIIHVHAPLGRFPQAG